MTAEGTVTDTSGFPNAPPAPPLRRGVVLAGRYELRAMLGRGGSATVYRAWDQLLFSDVAVKVLHPELALRRESIRRLVREVGLARRVRHPNVCSVFDLCSADGYWFVTMELAPGGSLRQTYAASGRGKGRAAALPPWSRRLLDADDLCAGLAAIHAAGVTHRDLTPTNILRTIDGRLAIADFGMAVSVDAEITNQGGTIGYFPPEVMMGQPHDRRSDMWQLGVVLHQVLLGHRPTWKSPTHPPTRRGSPVGSVPAPAAAMLEFCAACLSWDPTARPALTGRAPLAAGDTRAA